MLFGLRRFALRLEMAVLVKLKVSLCNGQHIF